MRIRLIGDIHGLHNNYIQNIKDAEYSIQLGDMGFNYDILKNVDSKKHVILKGNHDLYTRDSNNALIKEMPHILDDYGIYYPSVDSKIPKIFYVRGEYSIDKAYRVAGKNWFEDEELTYSKMLDAIEYYALHKPKIVISHGCPASMTPYVANPNFAHLNLKPSKTALMLEEMYRIHQPDFWFFGHYHRDKCLMPDNTLFFCIDELNYIDVFDTDNGYCVNAGYYKVEKSNVD